MSGGDLFALASAKDVVAEKLGLLSATSIQLRLLPLASDDSERLLDDGESIRPGWMIRAHQMVRVHVAVATLLRLELVRVLLSLCFLVGFGFDVLGLASPQVTACCGEPLGDVSVTAESITCRTDSSGTCQLCRPQSCVCDGVLSFVASKYES